MSSVFDTFTHFLSSNTGDGGVGGADKSTQYAEQREEARKRLYQGIDVRNRWYRFKVYKRCFVASEAVDFMVQSRWASSREEAVVLGQELQKNFSLFQHVVDPDKHLFADKCLFFKFNELNHNTNEKDEDESDDVFSLSTRSTASGTVDHSHRRTSLIESFAASTKNTGLCSVGHLLKENINHKYNMKFDAEGFYAVEAVDYMVSVGLASSRSDAVMIGLALQEVGGFIQNCTNNMDPFGDSKKFFVFAPEKDLSSFHKSSSSWKKDLEHARDFFRDNIKLVDHTYRLKTYKNTFTGKEAVDLLLVAGITSSRQDAVLLGRALMVEYNLFGHVVNEHEFEDSEFFYVLSRRH